MAHTYGTALAMANVSIPDHLIADVEVPILTSPQAQGDLLIYRDEAPKSVEFAPVPTSGVQVVRGEATGHTHWLHQGFDSPDVKWAPDTTDSLTYGWVLVPEGQSAQLIHTDEHGANGVGAGCYRVAGKREMAEEIRRVAD